MNRTHTSSSIGQSNARARHRAGRGTTRGGCQARAHQTGALTRAHAALQPEVVNGA